MYSRTIYNVVSDIDPNEHERPAITGEKLKSVWRELVAEMTLVFSKWSKSGSQNGPLDSTEGLECWWSYCNGEQIMMYAALCLNETDFRSLNKELSNGQESAVIGEIPQPTVANSKPPRAPGNGSCIGKRGYTVTKKSKTQQERRDRSRSASPSGPEPTDDTSDEESTIADSIQSSARSTSLIALLEDCSKSNHGGKNHKRVRKALAEDCGIVLSDSD